MTMDPQRTHSPRCNVFCMNDKREDVHHSCWCAEGALTYRQFRRRHPKWDTLPPEGWLATPDDRAWQNDMQQRSPVSAC